MQHRLFAFARQSWLSAVGVLALVALLAPAGATASSITALEEAGGAEVQNV